MEAYLDFLAVVVMTACAVLLVGGVITIGGTNLSSNQRQILMEDFFEDLKNRSRPNLFRRIYLWLAHDVKYNKK